MTLCGVVLVGGAGSEKSRGCEYIQVGALEGQVLGEGFAEDVI